MEELNDEGIVINITKGREIPIGKGIKSLRVSVEWSENRRGEDFDIDLMVVEVDKNEKAPNADYLVFYNSVLQTDDYKITDPDQAVVHSGDDRDGGEGEEVVVNIKKINPNINNIIFFLDISEAESRNQTFRVIRDAVVKVYVDDNSSPKLVYNLGESFKEFTNMTVCSIVRDGGNRWKFVADSEGRAGSIFKYLKKYGFKFSV